MGFLKRLLGGTGPSLSLSRAIKAVALDDKPSTRRALYESLLKSTLLIATVVPEADAQAQPAVPSADKRVVYPVTLKNDQGQTAWLAFTDADSFAAWKAADPRSERCSCADVPGPVLFRSAQENGLDEIVVNLAGPTTSGGLSRGEIELLAQGMDAVVSRFGRPEVVPLGTTVVVGPPAKWPSAEFLSIIRDGLGGHPEVKAAYVFQLTTSKRKMPLALGIEFRKPLGDQEARDIMDPVCAQAVGALGPEQSLDAMVLESDLLERVRQVVAPVFARE